MKKLTKRAARLASIGLCAAMLLTACGGNTNSGSGATSDATGETSTSTDNGSGTSTVSAPTGGGDGVLDVGYSQTPDSLTPFRPETNRDAPYMNLMCESLAVFDSNKELQPWIATDWSTEDNGFTYTININEGVTDSAGNAITAADIVWYISTAKELGLKPVFAKVESVTQTGDYSFEMKLTSNIVGTFEKLMTDSYAISQTAYENSADSFGSELVSTSPYEVTEFTANSILTLSLRDDYWQDVNNLPECVRPVVETISFHSIPESAQMGIALETGVIDVAMKVDASTGAQYVGSEYYTVELTDGNQGWQLFFSGADNSPCANDVNLRQAICYAIDVDGLVTGLTAGYGTVMHDAHSPIMIGYNPEWENEEYYPYDVEKAQELLAASDYNGEELSILVSSATFSQRLAQMIQNYLVQVGINVTLNVVEPALYTATRLDGTQYDMVINTIGGVYLADAWSIRYDPAAYETGDATSRHDYDLAELLYATWTPDGYTQENIDAVHEYLRDTAIVYGTVNPQNMTIWRNDLDLQNEVKEIAGYMAPAASTFGNL